MQIGAGSYVCGEETALLESLEGKRGEPRTKTFFPVEKGYLGHPTVINNVETLCAAARIMELGYERFSALGTPITRGTKLISVGGDCNRPGIFELEWGMTVAELLELCDAPDPYFIQVSGPSGQCISAWDSHRRFAAKPALWRRAHDFQSTRDILQIIRNFTAFFKHESCGMCTPCRAGNFIFSRKLDKIAERFGQSPEHHRDAAVGADHETHHSLRPRHDGAQPAALRAGSFPEYFKQNPTVPAPASIAVSTSKARSKTTARLFSPNQTVMEKKLVHLTIDGRPIVAEEGQNVVEVAKANGIFIPSLCYYPHINPPLLVPAAFAP